MSTMTTTRKLLLTALTVAVVGSVVSFGTFSAFSSTTENPGNNFATGSVTIADNDAGSALYNVSNAKPGQASTARRIKVTYSGSISSPVKLYRSAFGAGASGLDTEVDLAVTRGTGDDLDCTGFTAAASNPGVYAGKLSAFPASYGSGIALSGQGSPATSVTYRVVASLPASTGDGFQNKATGTHSFTWEAQSD